MYRSGRLRYRIDTVGHLGTAPILLTLLVPWALALPVCTSYEYEEEVFLEVDGSGRLRVSGSSEILQALHGPNGPNGTTTSSNGRVDSTSVDRAGRAKVTSKGGRGLERARSRVGDDDELELDSVRETEREGRKFVHVQGRFADWNELCAHPAFADRECRLDVTDDDELELTLSLPRPEGDIPEAVPPDATLALRFHFPSTVLYHNSRGDIERGNIIGWERTASEHFDATNLVVEARFERRSVLSTTVVILGTAVAVVLFSVALALFLMVRKGRRQLALEADGALSARTPTVHRRR